MVALTDLAVAPDNSRVFVSDAVLGVLLIDPLAHRSAMLTGPETLNLTETQKDHVYEVFAQEEAERLDNQSPSSGVVSSVRYTGAE